MENSVPSHGLVLIYKQNPMAEVPEKADEYSSGFDLYACLDNPVTIQPGAVEIIPTGLNICMPDNFEMQIRSRSGLAAKHKVFVLNSPGTVDASFEVIGRDEVKVILANFGNTEYVVHHKDRIAQAVFMTLPQISLALVVEEMKPAWPDPRSGRKGGFGSTGR